MSWALIRTFQWTLSFIKPKPNEATPIVPTPPSNNKTIVIFGATGASGSASIKLALEQGYSIVAAVRRPEAITIQHANLRVVKTDLNSANEDSIQEAIRGGDIVLNCLANPDLNNSTFVTESIAKILRAMKKENVTRLISLSTSGLYEHNEYPFFYEHIFRRRIFKNTYADLQTMEEKIKAESSWLNWTIIRAGGFFEGPLTAKYRYNVDGYLRNGLFQSTADVAHSLLAFSTSEYNKKIINVSY
jgi:putative NADH-flavin reductase